MGSHVRIGLHNGLTEDEIAEVRWFRTRWWEGSVRWSVATLKQRTDPPRSAWQTVANRLRRHDRPVRVRPAPSQKKRPFC
ncbi:hypothetical protein [Streptomyces sp. NPDC002763]|uniref:hypothetical protein n=1 Tax=Streptomyces sp. NPDC002763 TaxID=3154427 RepID=UPI003325D7AD